MTISDVQFVEELATTRRAKIWRARLVTDGSTVVIKTVSRTDDVGSTRCRNHFQLTQNKTLSGIAHGIAIVEEPDGIHLVMEDAGAVNLQAFLSDNEYDLETLLDLAEQIAVSLDSLHDFRILHRDLSLANIVIQPNTTKATIVDLGLAVQIHQGSENLTQDVMEGTLAYIAPEQTGRLRKPIDHRSDLYSLGAVLYHILTGAPPFLGVDALEVIHAHVTRLPTAPNIVKPSVPAVLSKLVMTLLEKEPEGRYQSAFGVAEDLRRIRRWLRSNERLEPLKLEHARTSVTFSYPHSFVGREAEVKQLENLASKALRSDQQLVLLSGIAGSGKSTIVRGFIDGMPRNGFVVASGKYEQYTSGQPLTGLAHALDTVVRSILHKRAEEVEHWRRLIAMALGEDIVLLIPIIPSLSLLTVSGSEVASNTTPTSSARETSVRLKGALVKLIEVVSTASHGFILVLDDLHWADEGTFDVIDLLLTSSGHIPIAVIATYRTEENLKHDHPVYLWPSNPQTAHRVTSNAVIPLTVENVQHIVCESLSISSAQAKPLAEALMQRTSGYPLFVSQFLAYLAESGILFFDRLIQRWTWSTEKLHSVPEQVGVAEVIQARVNQLPDATRHLMGMAGIIGTEFNIQLLSTISGRSSDAVLQDLRPSVSAGLITVHVKQEMTVGSFVHDRVQEVSVASVTLGDIEKLHATIARAVLEPSSVVYNVLSIFELADHLIQSGDSLSSADFLDTYSTVLQDASERARASGALREALTYSLHLRSIIGPEGWSTSRDIYSRSTIIAAETAGALGLFDLSHQLFDEYLLHVTEGTNAVMVYSLKAEVLIREGRFNELMNVGYRALGMLGIHLERVPTTITMVRQLCVALVQNTKKKIERRGDIEFNDNRSLQIADQLLYQLTSAGYNFSQEMMGHLTFVRGKLAAEHGMTSTSIDAVCQIGMVFLATGMVGKARDLAECTRKLIERSSDYAARARATFMYAGHIYFWTQPLTTTIASFETGIEYAVRSGSQHNVLWGEGVAAELRAFSGMPLSEQHVRIQHGLDNLHRVYQRTDNLLWTSHYFQAAIARVIHHYNPRLQPAPVLAQLIDNEEWLLSEIVASKDATAMCSWSIGTLKIAIATDNIDLARQALDRFNKYQHGSITQWSQCEIEYYRALVVGMVYQAGRLTPTDRKLLKTAVKRLQRFSKNNLASFGSRASIAKGIDAYVSGKSDIALQHFQKATQLAHRETNLLIEATALEWTALAAENTVMSSLVGIVRQKAARTYRLVGAPTLAEHIESHQERDIVKSDVSQRIAVTQTTHGTSSATVSVNRYSFDIDSIFKASNAIAGEIEHQTLVRRLLAIVLENAGADEGTLLIETDHRLTVEANLSMVNNSFSMLKEEFEKSLAVCKPAVHLVNRTRESVVIDEAFLDPDYSRDEYVTTHGVKSIMVMPIHHKGIRIGLLHLVNTRISHAFTPERLEVIQLLTSQIAVSLENARLYDEQRATLQAAARFVPTEFLDALGSKSIRDVVQGDGIRLRLTVLFVDIRQFTTLSEQLSAGDTFTFLNDYLTIVEPVIRNHSGFVDKYVGDAVMALFPNSPINAIDAGLEIQSALDTFNQQRKEKNEPTVRVGVGIHVGEVMLGTVGTGNRMDTTVIGDTVNIASRLEELTKASHSTMLVSEDVFNEIPSSMYEVALKGEEVIRGRKAPIKVFEILRRANT